MARAVWVLAVLVLAAVVLSGCTQGDDGTLIKSYTRSGEEDDADFTFNIAKGVKRLEIVFSTQGDPSSAGMADLDVVGMEGQGLIYMAQLGHGATDTQVIEDPAPGQYLADIDYDDYTGPAIVDIRSLGGSFSPGGGSGGVLAEQFWEILGIFLTLAVAAGGWFLYRHHTKRLDREIQRIDETFKDLQSDAVDCRKRLLELEKEFHQALVRNKLKESHFLILEKRIERYLTDLKDRMGSATVSEKPLEWE